MALLFWNKIRYYWNNPRRSTKYATICIAVCFIVIMRQEQPDDIPGNAGLNHIGSVSTDEIETNRPLSNIIYPKKPGKRSRNLDNSNAKQNIDGHQLDAEIDEIKNIENLDTIKPREKIDGNKDGQIVRSQNVGNEHLDDSIGQPEKRGNFKTNASREAIEQSTSVIKILAWDQQLCRDCPYDFSQCPNLNENQNCYITPDRNQYNDSDVVMLDPFRQRKKMAWPLYKPRKQKWIFTTRESQLNVADDTKLAPYRYMFNITYTFMKSSDILTAYGGCNPLGENRNNDIKYIKPKPKSKVLAWFVSNCNTFSDREEYVKELQKYIDVDIFGACGNFSCPKKEKCFGNLLTNTYKFYLSFENSLCKDYITEKLYQTFYYGTVPIVYGLGPFEELPPHSFIDVTEFASPKELAQYIIKLNANEHLYNEYFQWKNNYMCYRDNISSVPKPCLLCEYLHKNKDKVQIVDDLFDYWNAKRDCVRPKEFMDFFQ